MLPAGRERATTNQVRRAEDPFVPSAVPANSATSGAYFSSACAAFDAAARRAGTTIRDCIVGGTSVRLHFAGDAMVPVVFPALAHLGTTDLPAGPRLNLHVWDSASTGVAMPPPDWPLDAYAERGEIRAFDDGTIRAAFSVDGPIMDLWHRSTAQGVMWVSDHARVPYYERGAPIRRILSWWLADRGVQMIHAAAVGIPEGCVLIAGKGGSGKSNTALSCLGAGLTYLADDYCALETGAIPVAHSLYGTGKVHGDDLGRLTFLAGHIVNADRLPAEKALFFLADSFGSQLRTHAQVNALLLPAVRLDTPTRLFRASQGEAARAIAMSTIAQLPYAGGEVLRAVGILARQRPAFHLRVGSDAAERVPAIIRRLAAGDTSIADHE